MTDTPHVRAATAEDEVELMGLCRMLWEENGILAMDEDRVRAVLHGAFNKRGFIGVIGEPGKIEAMIFLVLSQFWYSQEWLLEELLNYCHPDYRRSGNAKHLIAYAKKCSDELGIPLFMGIISNDRTEQKVRLYQRQLAKPRGAFFIYGDKSPLEKVA